MTDTTGTASRFRRLVIAASLVGGLANLAAVAVVPGSSQALVTHSGSGLGSIISEEQPHVATRYQLYGQLREIAAGGSIRVPANVLDDYTLEHLSRLDVDLVTGQRPIAERVVDAVDRSVRHDGWTEVDLGSITDVPYVIATAGDDPVELRVYVTRRTRTIVVLDAALAEEIGLR